jgi:hypothetical protein
LGMQMRCNRTPHVIPGRCASIEPQMWNCTSGNLEVPGSPLARHPGTTVHNNAVNAFLTINWAKIAQ